MVVVNLFFFSYDVVFAFFFVCVFWVLSTPPLIGDRRGCRPGGDNCLFICFFLFLAKDCLLTGEEQALL